MDRQKAIVVGITGASGSVYGVKLIETLLEMEFTVHLVVSGAGWRVLKEELGWNTASREETLQEQFGRLPGKLVYHNVADIGASIASGSFLTCGMIVMPCSMGTLSSIASGASDNLMARARTYAEGRPAARARSARNAASCDPFGKHAEAGQVGRTHHPGDAGVLFRTANDRRSG
ncbi:hypothetical protein HMSSN036_04530 [Paenibacillus macerans]|nr:hypothetical protein HMSSN036_04530 [Paenibacillus macerans]